MLFIRSISVGVVRYPKVQKMMQDSFTLREVASLLKTDNKMLAKWIEAAKLQGENLEPHLDPKNQSRKLLTRLQLERLAALHGRTLPPDGPPVSPSTDDRLASLERQQTTLLRRIETLERRLAEMAQNRPSAPQQTALPLPETQEHRPPQKAISGPLPQGKPQRRHILLRVASEVLERHGGDARLLVVWGNLSADTGSVLRYASERGQTLHRCQVTGCACGEIIG